VHLHFKADTDICSSTGCKKFPLTAPWSKRHACRHGSPPVGSNIR